MEIGAKRENDSIVFYVKDNGLGIPEDEKDTIFERFKRGKHTKHIRGTGLGLSIVKGMVEAHNGKIWVESKLGEGSTFYFTIPIQHIQNEQQN